MNYELLSKLAMEEAEKSKNETLLLKKRNEILNPNKSIVQFLLFTCKKISIFSE